MPTAQRPWGPLRELPHFRAIPTRILILKVGLAGEVLRCTPLLRRLRLEYPDAEITWVTSFPDFVPSKWVHRVLRHSWDTVLRLQAEKFDLLLSLDKDPETCALASLLHVPEKRGFGLNSNGRIVPIDPRATHKWLTGVFDDCMLENRTHYVQEMFELCGFEYRGEHYILEELEPGIEPAQKPRIGLNTGASNVWSTRLWPENHWQILARNLLEAGYDVLLLGGTLEDRKNRAIAEATGARYEGVVPYRRFFGLIDGCDVVVTGVTMGMHVAIARQKPVILLNNIFNRHEFHLFGRGTILEPEGLKCLGCYKPRFDSHCPVHECMGLIPSDRVFKAVESWLPQNSAALQAPMT